MTDITPNHLHIYRDSRGKHITLDGHELLLDGEDPLLITGVENQEEITRVMLTLLAPKITIDPETEDQEPETATGDAPEPTLAEEIMRLPDYTMSGDHCLNDCYVQAKDLANRAEQIEQERDETQTQFEQMYAMAIDAQDERDKALAEVERLTAERDAPAPTIAEDLLYQADLIDNGDPYGDTPHAIRTIAIRAEQMETEWEEELDEISADRDHWVQAYGEAAQDRDYLAAEIDKVNTDILHLTAERDEALAEVERLTAERVTDPSPTLNDGSMTRHATVAREENVSPDLPDPADVKPGEAWIVNIDGVEIVPGFKASVGWICYRFFGGTTKAIGDERITLVSRLVPAPRVITNPDELDRLGHRTVILSTDGQADVYQKDSNGEWLDVTSHGYPSRRVIRMENAVTVLWEPEVAS